MVCSLLGFSYKQVFKECFVLAERVSAFAASWVHQKDLKLCGLKLNREKLKLEPMQVGQWLGFVIDTIRMQFKVPP